VAPYLFVCARGGAAGVRGASARLTDDVKCGGRGSRGAGAVSPAVSWRLEHQDLDQRHLAAPTPWSPRRGE